jgi:hypothetical protein
VFFGVFLWPGRSFRNAADITLGNVQLYLYAKYFNRLIVQNADSSRAVERCVHICNVTAFRNAVSWHCSRDLWPRNVLDVGYAITLRACSLRRRYLAVVSKGWCGYGLNRTGRATWHVTTVRSSHLRYIHDASGSRNKLGTPWHYSRKILLRHEARDESLDRNSVSFQSLATLRRYGTR